MTPRASKLGWSAALAIVPACAAQVVLLQDLRHVEMSVNGAAGADQACDDADEVMPATAFDDGPLELSLFCSTTQTAADSTGRMDCTTLAGRLRGRGRSDASARTLGVGAAASAFATSHYVLIVRVDQPTQYRFSGRLTASGEQAQTVARLRRMDDGAEELFREAHGGQPDAIFWLGGLLSVGDYLIEVEASSQAGAIDQGAAAAGAAFDFLLLTGPGAACPADHDLDGTVGPDDLAGFIGDFFSSPRSHTCDIDRSGQIDPDDLADYVNAYFLGCF